MSSSPYINPAKHATVVQIGYKLLWTYKFNRLIIIFSETMKSTAQVSGIGSVSRSPCSKDSKFNIGYNIRVKLEKVHVPNLTFTIKTGIVGRFGDVSLPNHNV